MPPIGACIGEVDAFLDQFARNGTVEVEATTHRRVVVSSVSVQQCPGRLVDRSSLDDVADGFSVPGVCGDARLRN